MGGKYSSTAPTLNEGDTLQNFPVDVNGRVLVSLGSPAGGDSDSSPLPAGSNRSGAIVSSNVAVVMAAANVNRQSLTGQNISTDSLWINELGGTAVAETQGSFEVLPGDTFEISTNRAISVVGGTAGQAWTAVET